MNSFSWRIIFFGTPSFALPSLSALLQGPDQVVAVVTQPDRKKGRGQKLSPSRVKVFALEKGINVFQPEKVKEESFQEKLRALHPHLIVVSAFGQILPKSILDLPNYGCINLHASLLPKYRGAAPIPWAILNGEEVTGVTIMKMDEGMDTGDILSQSEVLIERGETSETLERKLSHLGAKLLVETIGKMKKGEISPIPQDHTQATYAPMVKKDDGKIDWKRDAEFIDRQVRAFNPWPGAFTRWNHRLLKIFRGGVRNHPSPGEPGRVIWVASDFIEVATGKDSFIIQEVQLEGKRRMGVHEFLLGHPVPVGAFFE